MNYDEIMKKHIINKKKETMASNSFSIEVASKPNENETICPICDEIMEYVEDDNENVCNECGYTIALLSTHDGIYTSLDNEPQINSYKKIKHFTDWLEQIQSKKGFIPPDVYNDIKEYLNKRNITDMSKIEPSFMKQILKQLKYSKFYEQIPLIIRQLKGYNSIDIDISTEQLLKKKFQDLQRPFYMVKPKTRTNFLNYSYVLHKLCILIGRNDLANSFPILSNRKILIELEQIWSDMMEVLGWEFIRSI